MLTIVIIGREMKQDLCNIRNLMALIRFNILYNSLKYLIWYMVHLHVLRETINLVFVAKSVKNLIIYFILVLLLHPSENVRV